MAFKLGFDPQLRPETGTQNLHDGFRLAFWAKDHWVAELERDAQAAHPLGLGFARAAELFLLDVPLAAEATVLPHEILGHGGRVREFGGRATYHFELPPPFSLTPSYTDIARPTTVNTWDTQLLVSQAGIVVEAYEAHRSRVSSFEANTLNHIDSGLLVGVPIHEIFEATLPWSNNDVRTWTTMQATQYGASAQTLQRRYLVAASISTLLDPVFLYSCYDLFWRFLVLGKRTGSMPSLQVGHAAVVAGTHVSPVPWGLEYKLDVLGRWPRGSVFEIAPRWGQGPGGTSAGVELDATGLRILPDLVVDGGMDLWIQPELSTQAPRGSRPSNKFGARAHADVRWEHPGWFLGFRVGAKTTGLSGLQPIAPVAETVAYVGLLLDRP